MEYHYDYHNDRDGAQPPRQSNTPQRTPNPNGQSNDFGAWLLIGIMFLVAWPVGLILLIKKLTDNPKTKRAAANTAAQVRSRVQQTRTQAQQSARRRLRPSSRQDRRSPKKQSARAEGDSNAAALRRRRQGTEDRGHRTGGAGRRGAAERSRQRSGLCHPVRRMVVLPCGSCSIPWDCCPAVCRC